MKVNKYEYVKKSIEIRRQWVNTLKSKPCVRCQISYPTYVMDFHHVDPSKKKFPIGQGSFRRSRKSIEQEIEKCILLCSNCHRIVEHEKRVVAAKWTGAM